MSKRPRRNHTPAFKARVALATIKGDREFSAMPRWLDIVCKTLGQHDIAVQLCRGHHREVHRFGDGSRSACGRATSGGENLVHRST